MDPEALKANSKNLRSKPHTWPLDFSNLRSPPRWLAIAAATAGLLFVVFLLFLALISIARLAIDLLSDNQQQASEAVKSLLPIAAAVVGLPLIIWRLVILNQQTRISEAKTQIDRETHYTSIFSRGVEQLGQTREVKEISNSGDGTQSISRTAPNIEVRLGGIHSLTRLAEESIRDREKIENVLLSYVRENSWVDRRGISLARLALPRPSLSEWQYDFMGATPGEKAKAEYASWASANTARAERLTTWARALSETRVDVNEAVDAIPKTSVDRSDRERRRFYECLFVGRKFTPQHLYASRFERCTFVRCEFMPRADLELLFVDCQLLDCKFNGPGVRGRLHRCEIIDSTFHELKDSNLSAFACNAHGDSFNEMDDCSINLSHSAFQNCWFSGGGASRRPGVTLTGNYAALGDCTLNKMRLRSDSHFDRPALSKCRFFTVDLTNLADLPSFPWSEIEADPGTETPNGFVRPISWPSFDPEYEDEIPF